MDELVSIIMPSYNTSSYIQETIQSVVNQTYQNWELIIVDDCSSDDTDEIIKPYLKDTRISYYKNNKNLGAALSRNKALMVAKGRWIAFLDSDDLWIPDKLHKQILFMKEYNYHFSYTKYEEINEKSEPIGLIVSGPSKITRIGMYLYCWPGCLTVMSDRDAIGTIQVSDIKKNNDYAMWIKVSKKSDCHLLSEVLSLYRKRSGSISNHGYFKLIRWHYKLWNEANEMNIIVSLLFTILNLIFGLYKKKKYIEKY